MNDAGPPYKSVKSPTMAEHAASRRKSLAEQREVEEETRTLPPVTREEIEKAPTPKVRVSVVTLNLDAEYLVPVTRANAEASLKVMRGRSWDFGDQDGGNGGVGVITMCIRAPYWWMVQWEDAE